MPSAPDTRPHRVARAAGIVLTALVLGSALAGCGGSADADETSAEPLGQELAGSVAPLAQCRDWVKGTEEEKRATIADIRSQINLESNTVEAPELDEDRAFEMFENACSNQFAQGFRLYVLYARATGFGPLAEDVTPEGG